MLESNNLKKLVDQELPFTPIKKCLHGKIECRECRIEHVYSVPAEKEL